MAVLAVLPLLRGVGPEGWWLWVGGVVVLGRGTRGVGVGMGRGVVGVCTWGCTAVGEAERGVVLPVRKWGVWGLYCWECGCCRLW